MSPGGGCVAFGAGACAEFARIRFDDGDRVIGSHPRDARALSM
jgi:hypothetical protein